MTTEPSSEPQNKPRDAGNWAPLVDRLKTSGMPVDAPDLVAGRRLLSPMQGFGKMWQKTYRVVLEGVAVTPQDVIKTWKTEFPSFWPSGNRFYAPLVGIAPGEVALISVAAGPMRLSTGVMVLYADAESFTLMTPQGHMFAGWITFSSFQEEETTWAQVQLLIRAQDPLSELGFMFGGAKAEDRFWVATLRALAERLGVSPTDPTLVATCVDPRRNWSQAGNIWHSAGIRNGIYMATTPVRWLRRGNGKQKVSS